MGVGTGGRGPPSVYYPFLICCWWEEKGSIPANNNCIAQKKKKKEKVSSKIIKTKKKERESEPHRSRKDSGGWTGVFVEDEGEEEGRPTSTLAGNNNKRNCTSGQAKIGRYFWKFEVDHPWLFWLFPAWKKGWFL